MKKMRTLASKLSAALTAGGLLLAVAAGSTAQAYEVSTVLKTEHFAINQVILAPNESLDAPTQSAITGDIQARNRLDKIYQSTTVIFPAGSPGYTGKINTPIEGVLTISNYDSGRDRIYFNRQLKYATEGGLAISFDQIVEMVNQKAVQNLLGEFKSLPLALTNIPVKATGFDPTTGSFYITAIDDAVIIDARIDDSVYYSHEEYTKIAKDCRVDLLLFIDRMAANIPLFISGRAAINKISCANNQAPMPNQRQ